MWGLEKVLVVEQKKPYIKCHTFNIYINFTELSTQRGYTIVPHVVGLETIECNIYDQTCNSSATCSMPAHMFTIAVYRLKEEFSEAVHEQYSYMFCTHTHVHNCPI